MSGLDDHLIGISRQLLDALARTPYTPPEGSQISVKTELESLLLQPQSLKNLSLACALLSSSVSSTSPLLSWIPSSLALAAGSALHDLSRTYSSLAVSRNRAVEGWDLVAEEKRLLFGLMPEVLPLLKERIKESSIDKGKDGDEVFAASARAPVAYAILAAYQLRWFVTQIDYPALGKVCALVVPCGLTALDHWSAEVKGQGMISFVHLAKNVNSADLGCYKDVILDACCQNIASADEIWQNVVEMSVLLVTYIQRNNPRSPWYERMLNEMLGHLERLPRNKDRRIVWLKFIDPLFHCLGLVLLAHFRRLFPLFFQWMHADDDETVLLVLHRSSTVIRLTWIRNTPYIERLVDELVMLYKEASLRVAREEIRTHIIGIMLLLLQCKGQQFKAAWDKHRDDPNLTTLKSSLIVNTTKDFGGNTEQSDYLLGSSQCLTTQ